MAGQLQTGLGPEVDTVVDMSLIEGRSPSSKLVEEGSKERWFWRVQHPTFAGDILFIPIPTAATIPFNIRHEYGQRRQWDSVHAATADYTQGMHVGTCGGSPMRGDGEGRGSADWQGRWSDTSIISLDGWFSPLGCGLAHPRRWFVDVMSSLAAGQKCYAFPSVLNFGVIYAGVDLMTGIYPGAKYGDLKGSALSQLALNETGFQDVNVNERQ
ncbi:hypothetical protein ARMSODRAFT_1026569 [Armillaria solidipes]|uniref:Uncharacterized protein n=1 Tax=Armillaria solidipes TaxID=1076256 RepID=A0A2H3ARZ9_9AGAR|nr:hypothetical protein ARMSODRAFT_1026569 [Armillaria solidipes]